MNKAAKTITFGIIIFITAACASQNNQRPSGQQGGPQSVFQLISQMDEDKDGKLSISEVKGPLTNDFAKIDTNSDGFLTESELENVPRPQRNGRRQ